jgi:magnesium transporter
MIPHFPAPGSAPALLTHRADRQKKPPELKLVIYGPHHFEERKAATIAELPEAAPNGCVLWIEMNGLGDIDALRQLGEKYHLHPLALEDTLLTGQRPKFELYDEHAYILSQMVYLEP